MTSKLKEIGVEIEELQEKVMSAEFDGVEISDEVDAWQRQIKLLCKKQLRIIRKYVEKKIKK